jgi:hypothetical protein
MHCRAIYPAKVWKTSISPLKMTILDVGRPVPALSAGAGERDAGRWSCPAWSAPTTILFRPVTRYPGQYRPSPDFISTLKNLWWRLDRALDEESLYYSGLICSLEAIRSGCTAVIDHHASPDYIAGR